MLSSRREGKAGEGEENSGHEIGTRINLQCVGLEGGGIESFVYSKACALDNDDTMKFLQNESSIFSQKWLSSPPAQNLRVT